MTLTRLTRCRAITAGLHQRLPPIAPVRPPSRERQVPARPGVELHIVPDPPPPGAQVHVDPAGPPLVVIPTPQETP